MDTPRNVLNGLVNIRDIEINEWDDSGQEHHVSATWAKPIHDIKKCPKCSNTDPDLNRNGKVSRTVYDTPLRKPLLVELDRQRYYCKECESAFTPSHKDLYKRRKVTTRLQRFIWQESLGKETFWSIGDRTGLAPSTVYRIFRKRLELLDTYARHPDPTILSMDEIYFRRHGYLAIFAAPATPRVLEVLPSTKQANINRFLRKHRKRVEHAGKELEAVVMDMASHYRQGVQDVAPGAKVVVDRFHLEQKAYGAVHNVRRREAARADEEGREPAPTDGFRTAWKRRKDKLDNNWQTMSPREKMKLEAELKPMGVMENAYRTRQRFVEIFEMRDRQKAAEELRRWEESMTGQMEKDFKAVLEALSEWGTEILNYFDVEYTNGFIEGTNRTIRQIYHEGAGMTFPTLRAKVKWGISQRRRHREEGREVPDDDWVEFFQ
jgi:transposase